MNWLTSLLSGKDNSSIAIGRVLGLILFVNLLVGLPAVVACVLWLQKVKPETWFAYLTALTVYVPAIIAATAGIIAGTAFTEPKPPGGS